MTIYTVVKNNQAHDSDCWQHWINPSTLSYHLSEEGAKKKIEALKQVEIEYAEKWSADNPDYLANFSDDVRNNITYLSESANGRNMEEHELFSIVPIKVEE